jgi:hypothetical protein
VRIPASIQDLADPEKFAPLGPGLKVLKRQTLELTDEDLDVTATAVLELDEKLGRFETRDLEIKRGPNAPPMRDVLRQFRLTSLVEQFAMLAVKNWTMVEIAPDVESPIGTDRFDGEDEEHYVARIYRMATVAGYQPNKAVMEALNIAASTAAQKVWLARKLGLLPKTQRGKARGK